MNSIDTIEAIHGKGKIKHDEPLKYHTSLKIGGNAEFFIEIDKIDLLIKTVQEAKRLKLPLSIFGVGSLVNFSKKGVSGLVIKNNCHRFDLMSVRGKIRDKTIGLENAAVYAESGVNMNQLVRFTIGEGLKGLEYQLGLPGSVGGAIYTNAKYAPQNAYVSNAIESIRIINKYGEIQTVTGIYFINSQPKDKRGDTKDIILSAIFRLQPLDSKTLWERGMEAATYRNEIAEK